MQNLDLSILDDNDVIIAPSEILTVANIALMIQGKDISIEDTLKLDKSQLKDIITDFINTYDINSMLKDELELEEKFSKDVNDNTANNKLDENNNAKSNIDKDNDSYRED